MKEGRETVIRPPRLSEIIPLQRLFSGALDRSFGYFSRDYRHRVERDNTILRILAGRLHRRRIILIARHHGKLVGYLFGSVEQGKGHIFWLYVDPAARGSNVGLALLAKSLRIMRDMGAAEAELATYDHRHYYERQGFVTVDSRHEGGVKIDVMRYRL